MLYIKKINFIINLLEVKYRFFYYFNSFSLTFIICFYFKIELFFLISNIFLFYETGFIYTNLVEPFLIYIKLSFFFSLLFTFPNFLYYILYFFYKSFFTYYTFFYFIYTLFMYILTISLFIIIFIIIFPLFLNFIFTYQRTNSFEALELVLQATMQEYYNFFFYCVFFYLFLIFLPNLSLILVFLNIFKREILFNRYFRIYLYSFVIFNFLIFAPPDFFLQLIFLIPIIFLIEIYIYFIYFFLILYNLY
jgi:Sec-independent protein secretion pathway component TatC